MNNDDVRTCAAFIGAILGIINFVWNIIRTVKLVLSIKLNQLKLKANMKVNKF